MDQLPRKALNFNHLGALLAKTMLKVTDTGQMRIARDSRGHVPPGPKALNFNHLGALFFSGLCGFTVHLPLAEMEFVYVVGICKTCFKICWIMKDAEVLGKNHSQISWREINFLQLLV